MSHTGAKTKASTGITKIATVSGIDFTAAGPFTLYTVPANKKLILTSVFQRTATVDTLISAAVMSVGGNDPDYDNGHASITIGATVDNAVEFIKTAGTEYPVYAAGTVIKAAQVVAGVATAHTGAIDLFGYLIQE